MSDDKIGAWIFFSLAMVFAFCMKLSGEEMSYETAILLCFMCGLHYWRK